jgi:hypothetical protein
VIPHPVSAASPVSPAAVTGGCGPTSQLPADNAFGIDFTRRQPALTGTWISPEQHTVVQERDGSRGC